MRRASVNVILGMFLAFAGVPTVGSSQSAQELFQRAEQLMKGGDYPAAAASLRQLINTSERNELYQQAQLQLATCLLEMGEPIQACRAYEEFTKMWPGTPRDQDVRLLVARAYEARGDFLKAIAIYKEFLGRFPDYPKQRDLRLYLCQLYQEVLGNPKTALAEYDRLISENPEHPSVPGIYLTMAQVNETVTHDVQRAREAYATIVEKFPTHPLAQEAQLNLARLSDQEGLRQYPVAAVQYRKYLEKYPDAADRQDVWQRLAVLYLERLKQYQNAADAFDEIVKFKDTPDVRLAKLRALEKTQDPDRILPAYREFIAKYPKTPEARSARRNLARLLWDTNRRDDALAELDQLVRSVPESLEDIFEYAQRLTEAGKDQAAVKEYRDLASRQPSGDVFVRMSDCPLARIAAIRKKQQEADPENKRLPDTPETKAAYAEAEAMLKEALDKFPQHADIVTRVSWQLVTSVYEPQNVREKAVAALEPIFLRFPSYAHYAAMEHGAARLLENASRSGKLAAAEDLLLRASQVFPGEPRIRDARGALAGQYVKDGQALLPPREAPPGDGAVPKPAGTKPKTEEDRPQPDPAKAQELLTHAMQISEQVLQENDSDSAAILAYGALADAAGTLAKVQPQLLAMSHLARFANNPNFRAFRPFIEERRQRWVQAMLQTLMAESVPLETWQFKRDAEDVGEKEGWMTAADDGTWKPIPAGKDWGDFDGCGWYRTTWDHVAADRPYTLVFDEIQDEAWVYVNGELASHQARAGRLSFPFTVSSKDDEKIEKVSVVVRVKDLGGAGGLTGRVTLLRPKPLSGVGFFLAGLGSQASGQFGEALRHYEDYRKLVAQGGVPAGDVPPEGLLASLESDVRLLQGDPQGAEKSLPEKPDAFLLLRLSRGYESANEPERALAIAQKARSQSPKSLRCIQELASLYERQRLYAEAVDGYIALLDALPGQTNPVPFQERIIWLTTEQWRNVPKARELAERFRGQKPSPSWDRILGDLYKDRDPRDYEKAVACYRSYMNYAGKADMDVWHGGVSLWDLFNRQQKYEEAIAYAKAWREQFPNHPRSIEMIFQMGQTYRYQGRMADAAKTWNEVIATYPDSYAAMLCVSTAIEAFPADLRDGLVRKWFELNPGNPRAAEIYFALGQRYEPEQEGIPRAIEAYRTVWDNFREKSPENLRAGDRLNYLLFATGKVDEAAEVARQVIRKSQNQGQQEVLNAWYRLLDHYGPRVPFHAEVDSTLSAGTTPGRVTDGRTDGENGDPRSSWLSEVSPREHWVDCELYRTAAAHRVHIYWGHPGELPQAYKLQYRRGNDYVDIPGFENWRPASQAGTQHRFAPVTTDRIRVVQQAGGGFAAKPNQMVVAEVQVFELQADDAVQRYLRFVDEMTRQFAMRAESFHARIHLANFYHLRGEQLQANIEVQKALHRSPVGDVWHWDRAYELANGRTLAKRHGEAATILRTLLRVNPKFADKTRVTEAEKLLGQALTASGSGTLVIDPNAPEAGLLWGNSFALSGEEELAWERYLESKDLLAEHQHKLSPEFLRIIVRRHLAAREIKPAVEVCKRFLSKRGSDPHVADSDKAMMEILLGDCYYREERYEMAREHYTAVASQWAKTPEAIDARFKIVTVFLAQRVFDRARDLLDELLTHRDPQTVIRAHIMLGILHHTMGETKLAAGEFREVLMMSPNPETADEIIFRLGTVYKEEGRYKEAVDTLKLIGAWAGEANRVVAIGGEMRIRVSDRDLSVTRGSIEVPVVVQSIGPDGKPRDTERVLLAKSEVGAGLFVGSILTRLGDPEPGDHTLQVSGADVLTYGYDAQFARDFVIEKGSRSQFTLKVASDGRLLASSTEIQEEDELAGDAGIEALRGTDAAKRRAFRDDTEIKPGNNVYLRVIDLDLDRTPEPDTALVELAASSGDVVRVPLRETGPHTGKFSGQVLTGFRPPDAIASDCSEGREAIYAIDGDDDPQKCWMGLMDGQAPKWLQVDLKEVLPVDKVIWHRGKDAKDREPIRYQLQASDDNTNWQTVATVPESWNYHDKLIYGPLRVRTMPNYIGNPQNLREIMDMCELAPRTHGEGRVEWINDTAGNPFGPSEYYIAVFWGNLWCPESGTYEFATDSDDASFLLIDGELVAEYPGNHAAANNWSHSGKIQLEKGVHKVTYYFQEWEIVQIARVAWRLPSQTSFEVIPQDYFDSARHPDLAKEEKLMVRKFKVTEAPNGFGATITFDPRKARYLRMLIDEFHSDAPAIATFEVWCGDRKVIPSPGVDIHSLAKNPILELTPGDEVTVSYTDEMNLDPGTPVVRRENLSVTFYDASVVALTVQWQENEKTGQRTKNELLTKRVNTGDSFLVRIMDYDADTTDGVDTVNFVVRTLRGGTETKFAARETEPYSGVFEVEIATASDPRPNTLLLKDGDTLEIAYLDRENTTPGHPTERTWKVAENVPTLARVRVVPFGKDVEGEARWANPVRLISLEQGLTVEVMDPDQCLHEGSLIRVRMDGSHGKDVAIVECRVAGASTGGAFVGTQSEQLLEALGIGLFRGHIKTLLGDDKSPDFVVEAAGMMGEESVVKIKSPLTKSGSEPEVQIPVLNISGQDLIAVTYLDKESPDNPLETEIRATARILSNAQIGFFEDTYEEKVDVVHVGENLFIQVTDNDADTSGERDKVEIVLETSLGDTLKVLLGETLSHSGIFTASIVLTHALKADPQNDTIEADYGNQITASYVDQLNTDENRPVKRAAEASVIAGTDGFVSAFSKKYPSEEVAVETEFRIGECFYHLGSEHIKMKQGDLGRREIDEGRKVLEEVITHYPGSGLIDQVAFMLGNMAAEESRHDEAILIYRRIVRDYGESTIASEAQFNLAKAYEAKGDFDRACEEYVRLAYKFPDTHLLAEAMVRIGLYYFDKKAYNTAVSVFRRFTERFPDHEDARKVWFKMGLAYILGEQFKMGAEHFKQFTERFTGDPQLTPAAFYWAGDAYMKGQDALHAYQMFKRCVWDFPDTKWAKYARGRLTSPVFDRIAEQE